jgi:hypothetical protein
MTLTEKYEAFWNDIILKLEELIDQKGVESEYSNSRVLKLENKDLMYNLGDSNYVTEISKTALVNENGYTYGHCAIEIEQLCEIIDSFE